MFTGILNKCYKDDQISGLKGVTGGPRGAEWTILESFKHLSPLIYLHLIIKCVGEGGAGRVMVVEYFDYSGTARKVIYYWEPIKNYLADFSLNSPVVF